MIWLWIGGALVLAGGAVVPPLLLRRRVGRRAFVDARDLARSAISRLELAIDMDESASAEAQRQAKRCSTLAGSSLAGLHTTDAFRQAESWAQQGLAALGTDPDSD